VLVRETIEARDDSMSQCRHRQDASSSGGSPRHFRKVHDTALAIRQFSQLMPGIHIPRCASCLWSTAKSTVSQCRAYSTEVLRGKELGPIEQDEYQTFRVRKHGKSLPLPPALDPIKVEQKFKWQQTKKKPDVHNFTPFQKKIWKNPHGSSKSFLCPPARKH